MHKILENISFLEFLTCVLRAKVITTLLLFFARLS